MLSSKFISQVYPKISPVLRSNISHLAKTISANNDLKTVLPMTKIVATIGPASENLPILPQVVEAGMRIMRLNFSHATYEEADLRMKNLKLVSII